MRPQDPRRTRQPAVSTQLELGRKHKPDYWLLILTAILLSIGLIVVYAISPALSAANNVDGGFYVSKQLIAIALSVVALIITAKVPLAWWKRSYKPLLVIAAIATIIALILPVNPAYPAHRWVRLGSFSFQSVELVKFAVLIWLAGFLSDKIRQGTIDSFSKTLKPLLFALGAVSVAIVGIQSDLGSAGVMIAMMATMAYVAGLPLKRVAMISIIVIFGLILAVSSTPYRRERFQSYLNPQANCETTGYQACQALIAVGSGGAIGLGLGSSVQAYGYLPEAANDSIFAIYAEKFGFIGSALLLGVFVAFFARLKKIAENLPDDFSRLLVVGTLAWLSIQALINIGAMIGLLPLKGITLPFISYGGTSVVFAAAAVGLAFQASQYTTFTSGRDKKDSASREARSVRNSSSIRRPE